MSSAGKYTYGPVPSRRLGRSLGVDLVPLKTCTFNCVYCQLGPEEHTTLERADYAPVAEVVEEVRERLARGPRPDFITLGGSGEPTLHVHFGEVARRIRQSTDVPIALLTNGSLFGLPQVRSACDAVALVLPSLDAGDEETFRRINRPHAGVSLDTLVAGLGQLRRQFDGQVWLEVFIVKGLNSSDGQVRAIRACVDRIRPHRVQVNTAVRPSAESGVKAPSRERLEQIRDMLGPNAEIIAAGAFPARGPAGSAQCEDVLAMLGRRPCTVKDVAAGLGIRRNEALRHLATLLDGGEIVTRQRLYETYYEAAGSDRDAP